MIDLHSHILPGLDDGARTLEESREIARGALAEGTTAIAATPHVRDDWPTTAAQMEAGVAELRTDFAAHDIALDVLTGGEISFERLPLLPPDELTRFSLAATGRYVLLETPYLGWPLGLASAVLELEELGLIPILAHPERNGDAQRELGRVEAAVDAGALVQVTAASLDGRIGRAARVAAEALLAGGLVHVVASDAHTAAIREIGLAGAVAAIGDDGLARYLTEEAPAAIVAGAEVPEPPRRKRRRIRL